MRANRNSWQNCILSPTNIPAVCCQSLVFAMLLACFGGGIISAADDAAVTELRTLVAKIVDVQAQSATARGEWEAQKGEMQELLDLHQRELGLLQEELEKAGGSTAGELDRRDTLQGEIDSFKKLQRAMAQTIAENRPRTLALAKRFPEPLRVECEASLLSLERWQAGDDPRAGLQAILEIVAKAEQFNRRITRVAELREGRQVEVLYLGLARAYYTERDGKGHAGIGIPGKDGWEWQARPALGGELVQALDQLDRKRPPAFVKLPVQVAAQHAQEK